jgi:hypothetical protein
VATTLFPYRIVGLLNISLRQGPEAPTHRCIVGLPRAFTATAKSCSRSAAAAALLVGGLAADLLRSHWLALLFTFAFGAASGDLMAEKQEFGYLVTGLIVVGVIATTGIAWRRILDHLHPYAPYRSVDRRLPR